MLPGVPRELRGLFADEVHPRLVRMSGGRSVVASRTLRTTGIAEAALAEQIEGSGIAVHGLAYLPGAEGVDLRVTVRGLASDDADRLLDADIAALRGVAGDRAYGEGDEDLAAVVLSHLRGRGLSLAVAESCTGGMLGARLTSVPGSSDVFRGGIIAYSDDVKVAALGVRPGTLEQWGAVSEAVAREMASGVCSRARAQVGISITGIAGPGGATPGKPVGMVWVAVRAGDAERAVSRVLPGNREEIRVRATQMALDCARKLLGEVSDTVGTRQTLS
jgi:nicotinamide-nucleotide amidase